MYVDVDIPLDEHVAEEEDETGASPGSSGVSPPLLGDPSRRSLTQQVHCVLMVCEVCVYV